MPCSQHQELFPILLLSVSGSPHQAKRFQSPLNPMLRLDNRVVCFYRPLSDQWGVQCESVPERYTATHREVRGGADAAGAEG